LAGAAALAWYNFARFGSITEFGWHYQLQVIDQRKLPSSAFVSLRFLPPNLLFYLFNPPSWTSAFPYFLPQGDHSWLATLLRLTHKFRVEDVVGLVWSQSFLVFAPLMLFFRPMTKSDRTDPGGDADAHLRSWLTATLLAAAALGFLPILVFGGLTTMRYQMDVVPCATVLAAIGYWQTIERLPKHPRLSEVIRTACRLLVIAQCAMGILIGIEGQFLQNNYPLLKTLVGIFPRIDL
jgi:hypothetical protein